MTDATTVTSTGLSRRDILGKAAGAAAVAGAAMLGAAGAPAAARAAVPLSDRQAPGYYRIRLGTYEVTLLHDGARSFPMPD
ncbi:MAG TPA: hypothetical protein VHO91_08870, partial [Rhodopila sp.]|nr:hypothetical protein [Rhodopila sp.]